MKFLLSASIVFGTFVSVAQSTAPLFPINATKAPEKAQQVFQEVKDLILKNYYSDQLNEDDLYWAAIQGMLRHISPPENPDLATIWTAEEYAKILNSLKGESVSLGIKSTFDANTGSLTVTEIEDNSSAAGVLQRYDRILKIDGQMLKGMSIAEVNELLDGAENSKVKLTINREVEIKDVTVTRKRFEVKNLVVTMITSKSAALVEIHKIYQGLTDELEAELVKLKEQNVTRVILDLRHNTGGVLNEGIRVVNLFLSPRNIIVRTLSRSDQAKPIVADKEGFDFKLVVLIDESTASASEIIAGAMQDHKRATIIGTKTYGKGVIETTYTLTNEYRVKFITSAMYTPVGKSWQATGILPDFLVEQSDASYKALNRLPADQRLAKDIYLITALKMMD
jgi:carboxyl-terminal processing protease